MAGGGPKERFRREKRAPGMGSPRFGEISARCNITERERFGGSARLQIDGSIESVSQSIRPPGQLLSKVTLAFLGRIGF
jgi:hypothetical protein